MKKIIALCLSVIMCFAAVACSASFKTEKISLTNGDKPTVSISGTEGYSFELKNGNIQFTREDKEIAVGAWKEIEYYDEYIETLSSKYDEIEINNKKSNWLVFQSRTSPEKAVMVLKYNSDKVFFYVLGATVEDAKNLAQSVEIKQ